MQIEWQAQSTVNYALILSALALMCCVYLAVASRRTRAVYAVAAATPPRFDRAQLSPVSRRSAVIAAVFLVAVSVLVVPMPISLVVLLPAAAMFVLRRQLVAGVASVLLLGAISAAVALGQFVYGFDAHGGWPTNWDRVHGLGLMVTTLLLVATFRGRTPAADNSTVEGSEH